MGLFNFWKKKPNKEERIKAIKKQTLSSVDKASEKLKELNKILDSDDITLKIYYATRRRKDK